MRKGILTFILLIFSILTFGQHTISGRLVDSKKIPINGANVLVIGTTNGTVSKSCGEFELTTEITKGKLLFFVQESSFELEYELTNDSTSINVLLNEFVFGKNKICPQRFKKNKYVEIDQVGIVKATNKR